MFQALSFVFFISAVNRNILIRDGSLMVLASMLLWTLFLPMGGRFSVDALMEPIRPPQSDAANEDYPRLASW